MALTKKAQEILAAQRALSDADDAYYRQYTLSQYKGPLMNEVERILGGRRHEAKMQLEKALAMADAPDVLAAYDAFVSLRRAENRDDT
jgi:hypothetical protein